jgi:hypothetical protein
MTVVGLLGIQLGFTGNRSLGINYRFRTWLARFGLGFDF